MNWLYLVGYALIGVVIVFVIVRTDCTLIWDDNDALGVGVMVMLWPIAIAIVLASALGTVIIRLARRKEK